MLGRVTPGSLADRAGGETLAHRNTAATAPGRMTIVPLSTLAAGAIEGLLDRAFGADRQLRTAYRLRAGTEAIGPLSFAAVDTAGGLIGSIQCWPVALVGDDVRRWPMVLVGPVAVEPAVQRGGVGRALMRHMLEVADADASRTTEAGFGALMLIGDPEYYGRFGFDDAATGGWRLPGPFEPRRLLARGASVQAIAGDVEPRERVTA